MGNHDNDYWDDDYFDKHRNDGGGYSRGLPLIGYIIGFVVSIFLSIFICASLGIDGDGAGVVVLIWAVVLTVPVAKIMDTF